MNFSIIIVLLILLALVGIKIYLTKRYYEVYLYSGPYAGKMAMGRTVMSPPQVFSNRSGKSMLVLDIRDPKYILFRTESGEHILVNQDEKEIPKQGEKIIIRHKETGNFYVRAVKIVYDGYDNQEDYKFALDDDSIVSWSEIIGNLNYREII